MKGSEYLGRQVVQSHVVSIWKYHEDLPITKLFLEISNCVWVNSFVAKTFIISYQNTQFYSFSNRIVLMYHMINVINQLQQYFLS